MRRKKKGSTLVTTIITFGALLTVGTAMLAMSMGDYKMRLSQNKRIMNLYGSDSGLDVAYDIMVKNFDSAAQFGAFKAKQLEVEGANPDSPHKPPYVKLQEELNHWLEINTEDLSEEELKERQERIEAIPGEMEKLKNKEFRRSFKTFLYVPDSSPIDTPEYTPNQLKTSLEKGGEGDEKNTRYYFNGIKKITETSLEEKEMPPLTEEIRKKDFFNISSVELVSNDGESEPVIKVDIQSYPDVEKNVDDADKEDYNKNYEIRIESTFKTVKGNTNVNGENKRTVESIYSLKIPDYKDVVFGESEIKNYYAYEDKGLTIGGNMNVGSSTDSKFDLTVDGNIFVQGNSETTNSQNKYQGGISLNNVNDVDFANIEESLYAGNVYAGVYKDKLTGIGDNCTLNVGQDMILDNDLTLNATATNISTKNFYGINDKTITKSTAGNGEKVKNSSSIIVNKYKNNDDDLNPSGINISNEALIMGVAYINTVDETGYATGESVGVKGNYNAYSEHVDSDNTNGNNLNFDKDEDHKAQAPLYLINGTVVEKDQHFFDYWSGKLKNLDTGGVHFGTPKNIYSVGSIVYKDENGSKVVEAKGAMESLKEKSELKQKEYALRVYDMDMNANVDDAIKNDGPRLQGLYNNSTMKSVYDLMSFPNIEQTDRFLGKKNVQIGDVNGEVGIFSSDAYGEILIQESKTGEFNIKGLEEKTITISVPKGKILNAFIATAGNVIIEGNVEIKGNIIANGNLDIKGTGKKTITYDKEVAANLQVLDAEIFEQVFNSGYVKSEINDGAKTEIVVQYDLPKFLKNLLWKLVK